MKALFKYQPASMEETMRKILTTVTCLMAGAFALSATAESNLAPTTSLRPRIRPEYLTVGNSEATKPDVLIDADGDGHEALTCGWAEKPCPSNDSFNGIDVFALDMNDNDPKVGSYCTDWPLDPYCEPS
jgi:hypothetical protein